MPQGNYHNIGSQSGAKMEHCVLEWRLKRAVKGAEVNLGKIWIILKDLLGENLKPNMKTGTWGGSLIVLKRNMLHLLWWALVGNYQGLKETPGVTPLSLNAGISLPSCQVLSPTQWGSLMTEEVSVSMASQTQTASEIREGTRPRFSADPAYQQQINTLGNRQRAACEPYGPGWALMKQLKSWWAGNSLMAACQSSSKYPTLTLYSVIWLLTQPVPLTGNIWSSFYFPPGKSYSLCFSWFGFCGILSVWCYFPVELI